jgi:hypothetical protein
MLAPFAPGRRVAAAAVAVTAMFWFVAPARLVRAATD